jgi:hypothetical protein
MTGTRTDDGTDAPGTVVELRDEDRVVTTAVYSTDAEVRVEVTTRAADGTLTVETFRFDLDDDVVVPKYGVDPRFRLVVGAALRRHGYVPEA